MAQNLENTVCFNSATSPVLNSYNFPEITSAPAPTRFMQHHEQQIRPAPAKVATNNLPDEISEKFSVPNRQQQLRPVPTKSGHIRRSPTSQCSVRCRAGQQPGGLLRPACARNVAQPTANHRIYSNLRLYPSHLGVTSLYLSPSELGGWVGSNEQVLNESTTALRPLCHSQWLNAANNCTLFSGESVTGKVNLPSTGVSGPFKLADHHAATILAGCSMLLRTNAQSTRLRRGPQNLPLNDSTPPPPRSPSLLPRSLGLEWGRRASCTGGTIKIFVNIFT